MDYSIIENKLRELINKFDIEIEKSNTGTWANNPDILYFSIYPTQSTEILKILKFYYFIRETSKNSHFRFKYYSLSFDIEKNKTEQFYEYLTQMQIPKDLNEIFPGVDLEEMLRDFSGNELSGIVKYYPERAREFMVSEYGRLYKETVSKRLDERKEIFRSSIPVRYDIWEEFIKTGTWHLYLEEISYGQSENWARHVASANHSRSLDERYAYAFNRYKYEDWNSAMRDLWINIHRRFGNESDMFANKYFDFITNGRLSPLALTQSYISIYNTCIDAGRNRAFADKFANGMISDYRDGDESYWIEKTENQSQNI